MKRQYNMADITQMQKLLARTVKLDKEIFRQPSIKDTKERVADSPSIANQSIWNTQRDRHHRTSNQKGARKIARFLKSQDNKNYMGGNHMA